MIRSKILLACLLALSASTSPLVAQTRLPTSAAEISLSFAPIVKRITPAVVNVYATRTEKPAVNPLFDDPFFREFFGGGPNEARTSLSLGSGVLVDQDGLVVTNNHVVEGMTSVKVALQDHREFDAKIVLRDPKTDLAVLRIDNKEKFPILELSNSDRLEIGDLVLAIGNPFGVGQTVTHGIISALSRTQALSNDYGLFIQTDAAINPGNSGGALVDMSGKLVGINAAIVSKSGGSLGIGFAIPANMVRIVLENARAGNNHIRHPWVGATFQTVSSDLAETLKLDRPTGALIAKIYPESPAAKAGLKQGDVLLEIADQPIDDPQVFGYRVATYAPNTAIKITYMRDGNKQQATLTPILPPEIPVRTPYLIKGTNPFEGALIWALSPAVADELSIEDIGPGVVIADLSQKSAASRFGMLKGDIIYKINDTSIKSIADLQEILSHPQPYWQFTIKRGDQLLSSLIAR